MVPSSGRNATLYESPPVMLRRMHPSVPRLGGSTVIGLTFEMPVSLIWKAPEELFLIPTALIAVPFSNFESLYLKPFTLSPLQNGLPEERPVPLGRLKVWSVGRTPFARTVIVAPGTGRSPAVVSALAFSYALPTIFRLSGVLGFFNCNVFPRMVWSAACADVAVTPASRAAAKTRVPTRLTKASFPRPTGLPDCISAPGRLRGPCPPATHVVIARFLIGYPLSL